MAKKPSYQIPFDMNGNQLHYPESFRSTVVWHDIFEFEDTLIFDHFSRGQR